MDILARVNKWHCPMVEAGWGNGYVGVPPGHPWHGKDYDDIHRDHDDMEVHGGLTYAGDHCPGNDDVPDGYWWVGFDCGHYGDTPTNCPRAFVEAEAERLRQFAEQVAV